MARISRWSTLVILAACAVAGLVSADLSAELNYQQARRLGLEPMWSVTLPTGAGGSVTGFTLHVSPSRSYQATDVVDRHGRRRFFSQRDLTLGVSRGGYDQASRLARRKQAELAARGLEPRLEKRDIPVVTAIVTSNLGTVTSLDAESGQQHWSTPVGRPGFVTLPAAASETHVCAVNGSTLYLLSATQGNVLDSIPARAMPGARPTIHGDLVYVPTTRGLVHAHTLSNLRKVEYTLGAVGQVRSPITISPTKISFSTSRGYMYVANLGQRGIQYRFQSLDTITAAPVWADNRLFATSVDGFVYAIDEKEGEMLWRFAASGPIRRSPVVAAGRVLSVTEDGQLACLDADNGGQQWSISGIDRCVSVTNSRLYAVTMDQKLAVIDLASGAVLGTATISGGDLPFTNTQTDRIYLVGRSGRVQCLRQADLRWPQSRAIPSAQPADSEATDQADAAAAAKEQVQPAISAGTEPDPTDAGDGFDDMPATDEGGAEEDPFGFDSGDGMDGDDSDPFDDAF